MTILTGLMRLGRDAEVKTVNGDKVANLSLAYDHGRKDDKATVWVDAALWGKRAEALAQYLTKGTPVVVVLNDPHVRTYKKKDGTEGWTMAGTVIDLTFAGKGENKPKPEPTGHQGAPMVDDDLPFAPLRRNELL